MSKYLVILELNGFKFGIDFYAYMGFEYPVANQIADAFKDSLYSVEIKP